jgi:hypothetical protein
MLEICEYIMEDAVFFSQHMTVIEYKIEIGLLVAGGVEVLIY